MRIHALFAFYGVLAAVTGKTVEMMKVHHEIKKCLSLFIALAMLFGVSGTVYAAAASDEAQPVVPSGIIRPTPEEEEAYWNSLSEEEKQLIAEKEAEADWIAEEWAKQPMTRAATKISIPGTFTIYQQEETMYCAPACVKSMIQYLNGSSPSQSVIAGEMGTSFLTGTPVINIAPYLKEMVGYYYSRQASPTQSLMCSRLYTTIVNNEKPCLMAINNPTGNNWHYPTDGHALVVNAIYSDRSKVQFADPAGGNYNRYFYEKTAGVAHSVCTDVIW